MTTQVPEPTSSTTESLQNSSNLHTRLYPRLPTVLKVFEYRNYRLFFFGQLISVIGTWMQSTALQWLVYQLTDSQSSLGIVTFLNFLPVLLFSLFMGVVVDRFPKQKLLLLSQSWFMVFAAILAFLTFTERVEYWQILLLSFLVGIGNALDMPTRQAFYVELVNREDLTAAIGLNSALFNTARIIGPVFAGVIVAAIGEAPAFAINALTFLAVILALLMMQLRPFEPKKDKHTGLEDLLQGLHYLIQEKVILGLVIMVALISFIGAPYMVLLPVFARDILEIGATGFGQLLAAQGIGALLGAISVIVYGDRYFKGRIILISRGLLGVAVLGLGLSKVSYISMIALVIAGYAFITQLILTNTLIQHIVPDQLRGRVMSAFTWALAGFFPLGSLVMGVVGDQIGAAFTAILMGVGCLIIVFISLILFPQTKYLK